ELDDGGTEPGDAAADLVELGVELGAVIGRHQPNLPVTYCSVRSSSGLEKIFAVGLYSTSRPVRRSPSGFTSVVKNAVWSLTRAACCMLWVTMTIVKSCLISCISSSMRAVAIGSRA